VKTIQIDRDLHALLTSRAESAEEPLSAVLRRELAIAPPLVALEVDDDVYSFLVSRAADVGESASSILRRELKLSVGGGAVDPDGQRGIVEFHIPRAVGAGPWNTREQMIQARVGDTLRLVNDDTVPRRLHTSGSPFPHPDADIMPGQAEDLLLLTPFDPGLNQPLHDHVHGVGAQFWITVQA
jgi:hypothetical protein